MFHSSKHKNVLNNELSLGSSVKDKKLANTIKNIHHGISVIDSVCREASWFHPSCRRAESEEILLSRETGSFLVRRCSNRNLASLCLSVRGRFSVEHHLLIVNDEKGLVTVNGSFKEFRDISSLVTHLSVMKEVLSVPLKVKNDNHGKNCKNDLVEVFFNEDYQQVISRLREIFLKT